MPETLTEPETKTATSRGHDNDRCAGCGHARRLHGKSMGWRSDDCHKLVNRHFCECEGFEEASRGAGR